MNFPRFNIRRTAVFMLGVLAISGCSHAVRSPGNVTTATTPVVATGIPACDTYLNNYVTCHRVAGVYTDPATLQAQYEAMRSSLLQDAHDPHVRPYLANRCVGLITQLDATLKGHSCTASPASSNHRASP